MSAATAATWYGRRGSMVLGPTEDRVARYLADATKHGRVTIRTADLAARLQLGRSEAYRITARLRVLGLFGIENDRSGARGGRRYWRTATPRDGDRLDATKHRAAWARVVGWARAHRARILAALPHLRPERSASAPPARATSAPAIPPAGADGTTRPGGGPHPPPGTFAELMRAAGLGPLMDEWARPRIAR